MPTMRRLPTSAFALVLLLVFAPTPADARARHTEFTGGIGIVNPCNGEVIVGTGPVKIVYVESAAGTHFVVHHSFMVKTEGSLGNDYVLSLMANGQFDAPTGGGPGFIFFDVPVHSEVISNGGAPNFSFDLGVRVFVANGVATGSILIGPSATVCHG